MLAPLWWAYVKQLLINYKQPKIKLYVLLGKPLPLRYIRNSVIHNDFKIATIRQVIKKTAHKLFNKIELIDSNHLRGLSIYDSQQYWYKKRFDLVLFLKTDFSLHDSRIKPSPSLI